MSVAVETVLSLLFPPRCAVCGRPIRPQTYVCESCKAELARITAPYCPFCGMNTADCTCRKQPHAYSQVIAPFYYEGGVRQMLLALKYGGRQEGAAFLAEELMRELSARLFGCSFDLMTCIPTTRERIAERGYNQAESIAACIKPDPKTGFLQGTERDFRLLRKNRTDSMQHFLGASGRRANIRNAFSIRPGKSVEGKRILLVDDIVTTGSTAEECSEILRLCGAEEVVVACAALTRRKNAEQGTSLQETEKVLS